MHKSNPTATVEPSPHAAAPGKATRQKRSALIQAELQDYSCDSLAERIGCNVRTVQRAIARREVPGMYRLGRLVRICRKIADEWLAAGAPRKGGRA